MGLPLKNWNPYHSRMLSAKFGWNLPSGPGEKIFFYFVIISPLTRAWPYIWTNFNPLHPRMLCAKFGWNWPSGSWEKDENVKFTTTTPTTMSWRRRRTNFDQKSSLEPTAQFSEKCLPILWLKVKLWILCVICL